MKTFTELVQVLNVNELHSGETNGRAYQLRSLFVAPIVKAQSGDPLADLGIETAGSELETGEAFQALTFESPCLVAIEKLRPGNVVAITGTENHRKYYSKKEGRDVESVDFKFHKISAPINEDLIPKVIERIAGLRRPAPASDLVPSPQVLDQIAF